MTLPLEIVEGFKKSQLLEGGGLAVTGVDEGIFVNYLTANWQNLVAEPDSLPRSNFDFETEEQAAGYPLKILAASCESLPPTQYVGFLENVVGQLESGKISPITTREIFDGETYKKQNFVAVNWQDSKIQNLLDRVIAATPKDQTKGLDHLFDLKKGELAEAYLANRESETPLPQTLPGVKLSDSEGLLAKAKRLISHDRSSETGSLASALTHDGTNGDSTTSNPQIWMGVLAVLVLLFAIYKVMKKKRSAPKS